MGSHSRSHSRSHHRSNSRSNSSDKIQNTPYNHFICIFLTFISTLFLFLVILYNVPFSSDDTGGLKDRLWLLKLKDRSTEYGFGIWGFCSWSTNSRNPGGTCTKKSFWKLPGDAVRGDGIGNLNLPPEISKSLSISGFFLVFVLISSVFLLLSLFLTLRFHYPNQPSMTDNRHAFKKGRKMLWRTFLAFQLRNVWLRLLTSIWILAFTLPVIVISVVGVNKIKDLGNNNVVVKLGSGWIMALVSIILLISVQIAIPMGGLWNNSNRSGRDH
ncbi:uncharacterized protein L201_000391 [Kwoniella dendrophila CBS 6074]|uniref:CSC1/OSCA1-like N-terminal transmembrane domain-containing protein n=1 Tax=Kwoniella dendrophila CBS 6074 TaxID=1295534 RepID=A0AAX4JL65_9TREE